MSTLKRLSLAVFMAIGMYIVSEPAEAALVGSSTLCSQSDITNYSSGGNYLGCSGVWEGRDASQTTDVIAELQSEFGNIVDDWNYDEANTSDSVNASGRFTIDQTNSVGTIKFDTAQTGTFAVALKSGGTYALYAFDGGEEGIETISWKANGNGNLTHGQFYALNSDGTVTAAEIPEPLTIISTVVAGGVGYTLKRYRDAKRA